MIHVTALERSLCRPLRGWREGGRAYPRAAPRVPRGWPWATACRPLRGWKRGQSMSQGGSYRGRRGEGPMQKQDVVVRGSRLLVWDRRPRRSGTRGRCGRGRYPGPLSRHSRLGHTSLIQRHSSLCRYWFSCMPALPLSPNHDVWVKTQGRFSNRPFVTADRPVRPPSCCPKLATNARTRFSAPKRIEG